MATVIEAAAATEELTVTLPRDLADRVREKVASGEYGSPSEVVQEGLAALAEDERALISSPAFQRWVRDELQPAIAEYRANPSVLIPLEEVRARLAARHARRSAE